MQDGGPVRLVVILAGFLSVAVAGLVVALVFVASGDDELETVTITSTERRTVTTTAPATQAEPVSPTVSRSAAESEASRAASRTVDRFGISLRPGDFDTSCEAPGGGEQASVWRCNVRSKSGQCSGTISIFAKAGGAAGTRNNRIGCGE